MLLDDDVLYGLDDTTIEYPGWELLLVKDASMDEWHCLIELFKENQVCYIDWRILDIVGEHRMDEGKGSLWVAIRVDDADHYSLDSRTSVVFSRINDQYEILNIAGSIIWLGSR